ncbi:hypothetical protein [Microlunatus ginsengisoli]|uniref:VOC domain-containing protein n=1 Tax=Microlunatus ginsengisoli TaxID=363863 RepID=A0ABP7AF82_9ACTN
MQLHPIMYVADQYAERDFCRRFGFEDHYEGDEFPGFLAIRHGAAVIGLQRSSAEQPAYEHGLRWQFELDSGEELDVLVSVCERGGLDHELSVESGGSRFRTRLLTVVAPSGVRVVFEEPGQA